MATPRKTAPKKAAPKAVEAEVKSPAQAEAEAPDTFVIRYADDSGEFFDFEIIADPDEWPSAFHMGAASLNKNQRLWALRMLMGEAKWVQFNVKFPARKHALKLADLVAEHSGLGNAKN